MTRLSFKKGYAMGLMALALMGLDMAPAMAGTLSFIKFDGVDGESTQDKHKGEIALASWDFEVRHTAQGVGSCANVGGCTVFEDIKLSNVLDSTTPKLFGLLANGDTIPTALIKVDHSGDKPNTFFTILFTDVQLTAMKIGTSGGGNPQVDTAFSFSSIKMSYFPQKPDGSLGTPITAFYDLVNGGGSIPQLLTVFALGSSDSGVSAVPLPPALTMMAAGLLAMVGLRRRVTRV